MKKLQVIDLVRTLSILVVLAGHLQALFINNGSKYYFLEYLWFKFWLNHGFGVSIFFVVSGFLITRLLAQDEQGLYNPDMRNFYVRRAGRIFPLLLLICLIRIAVNFTADTKTIPFQHCFGDPKSITSVILWVSIATFSMNWYKLSLIFHPVNLGLHWYVLWSLSIEEQFYFFYPFLLKKLGGQRNLVLFLALMILLGPLSILAAWQYYPRDNNFFYNSFAAFNMIAMGCLLYLASERYHLMLKTEKRKSLLLCLSGLLILWVVYFHVYVRIDYWWTIWGNNFIGIAAFLFLLGGLHMEFFEKKFWSFLTLPGRLSYGIYLFHSTVLFILWPYLGGLNQWVAFFFFSAATTAVAWLSFRFFEVPANLWVRKVTGRPAA